jgi:hypothetical protein
MEDEGTPGLHNTPVRPKHFGILFSFRRGKNLIERKTAGLFPYEIFIGVVANNEQEILFYVDDNEGNWSVPKNLFQIKGMKRSSVDSPGHGPS